MLTEFDPNAAATEDSGIFGLPYSVNEATLVLIPVPWEATTSYGGGTSLGPKAIFEASKQVDLYDIDLGNFYEAGIAMLDESADVLEWNDVAKHAAQVVINTDETTTKKALQSATDDVNAYSEKLNELVYRDTKRLLAANKLTGLVGGDHSTPFGAIKAYLEKYPRMGILHFDAHADLRNCFEGFEYSHASIMYNVMTKTSLSKIVQVGIRDFCEEEYDFIKAHSDKITTFFDTHLAEQKMGGKSWAMICEDIIAALPTEVYVSFDIDGLNPLFCPHTGTPVPGGLDYREALYLLKKVVQSGRKIVGFDLNEVSPGSSLIQNSDDASAEWDANVGARLLYKLCGWTLASSHKK